MIMLPHPTKSNRGKVVALGPDCNIGLEVGHTVLYRRWTTEVTVGGETYRLVNEDDVLATVMMM